MTLIHSYSLQPCPPSGIRRSFRCWESGPSARSLAALLGRRDREAAAGLKHLDAAVDALVSDGVLTAEEAV